MLRRFFKDSAVYSISNIISRGISLLLVPFYTHVLHPGDLGIIDMLILTTNLINLSIAVEVSQGLARYFPDTTNNIEKIKFASTALIFTVLMHTIFLISAITFLDKITKLILGSQNLSPVMLIALFSIWCNGIFYIIQSQLRWQLQPRDYAVSSILFSVLSLGVTVLLIVVFKKGVKSVFYGKITGYFAGVSYAFYRAKESYRFVFSKEKLKEMLVFSTPLVPSSIAVFVATYIDRIAINKLMSLSDVGIYGVGYRFATIVSFIMVGFQGALTPLIYAHYKNKETPSEISRIFRYFLAVIIPLILLLGIFSREILMIFTTKAYYSADAVIPILAAAIVLSKMYVFFPGLSIAKKTKYIALINILVAAENSAFNFMLIPYLGIKGAAIATLTSALSSFIMYVILSQKFYKISYSWPRMLIASITVSLCITLFYHIQLTLINGIILKFLAFGIVAFLIIFLLIGWKELCTVYIRIRSLLYRHE